MASTSRTRRTVIVVLAALILLLLLGGLWWRATHEVTEHTDYREPPAPDTLKLVDDRLEDKNPAFDSTLVDSRLLGDWAVNKSAAVIKLDCPMLKPDRDAGLLALHPSYAAAAASQSGQQLLPSANMLDGAAKQFDDGLYAAVDLACFQGKLGFAPAAPDFVAAVFAKLPSDSPAKPFLAAALDLAGKTQALRPDEEPVKKQLLSDFERDKAYSTPIAFYNWTPDLKQVWRFYRFLQRPFSEGDLAVPRAMAGVLGQHPPLLEQYRAINRFYAGLTNPMSYLPVDALIGSPQSTQALATQRGLAHAAVAIFPPATSRETELFDRLFPQGAPPGANLMNELIRRIRSGEVDLAPSDTDGWYQYQVHALETLVLPSKGQEKDKLLLTAKYKKRLIEAFKALMTKRRETHARRTMMAGATLARQPEEVKPRLRLEPCATFYLRTARAYAFVQNVLTAAAGKERLAALHGLRKDGPRGPNLPEELQAVTQRFYGFYLVACEDIGMRPGFLEDESVDQPAAMKAALDWLAQCESDPDLACDTRVAVPIQIDPVADTTRIWATVGVRLARLEASYARPPKVRPTSNPKAEWHDVEPGTLAASGYVIPVDEFAEIELKGSAALTRAELRAVCDEHKTKGAIVDALARGGRR